MIEELYEDISRARNLENTHYVIITGDFNAKIGKKQPGDTNYIGNFDLGERNDRGDMLVNFVNNEKLYCMNTFLSKTNSEKIDMAESRRTSKKSNRLYPHQQEYNL